MACCQNQCCGSINCCCVCVSPFDECGNLNISVVDLANSLESQPNAILLRRQIAYNNNNTLNNLR